MISNRAARISATAVISSKQGMCTVIGLIRGRVVDVIAILS